MTMTKLFKVIGLLLALMLLTGLVAVPVYATGEVEDVKIEGMIDKIMPKEGHPGVWKLLIGDKTVIITVDTEVDKLPLKGTGVDVEATPHYGVFLATRVQGETDELEGKIAKIGYRMDGTISSITVNYVKFCVTEETEIVGKLMVGTMVRVKGEFDGGFIATKIEVLED